MKKIMMREYTTAMLCITVFFLFADQNLLAPNLSAIAKDFGMNDHERDEKLGGYIAIGFFIVGGLVALLVGYFADTVNRATLFGFIVIFGESAGFATYFVKNYSELFFCRVLTGISIGGANPVIFSILGDLYSGNSRIYVSTLIGISQSAGIAFGQFLAGMIGPSLGWRTPFMIIALPAITCGFIVFFSVKEPRRGGQEKAVRMLRERRSCSTEIFYGSCSEGACGSVEQQEKPPSTLHQPLSQPVDASCRHNVDTISTMHAYQVVDKVIPDEDSSNQPVHYSEKIEFAKLFRLFQTVSAVLIFVQGLPGCLPWGMIFVFLNDYLSVERGLSVQSATGVLTCFGIGGLFGQLFGGWLGQRLYNRDVRYQCLLMGLSTLLSVLPMLYLLNSNHVKSVGFFFVAVFGGFIVNINGPNVRVVLQNISIPEIRGTAFAIFSLADDIGKGLGPALVVQLIQACHGNRQKAFNIVVLFWIFCGVLLLLLTLTVPHDEEAVHETVKRSLMKQQTSPPSNTNTEPDVSTVVPTKNNIACQEYSETAYVKIEDDGNSTSIRIDRSSSNDLLLPVANGKGGYQRTEKKITIEHSHYPGTVPVPAGNRFHYNPLFSFAHTRTVHFSEQGGAETTGTPSIIAFPLDPQSTTAYIPPVATHN